MKRSPLFLVIALIFWQCSSPQNPSSIFTQFSELEQIAGKEEYKASPFVTAGDRLYMVGHQNGQFPDLGWHVTGEMGGIWDHPIKLMDGFTAAIHTSENSFCLTNGTFTNYPFFNTNQFEVKELGLEIARRQFVPDGEEAVFIEFEIKNNSSQIQDFDFEFNGMTDLRPVWLGERTHMKDGGDFAAYNSDIQGIVAKDSLNDWFVAYGSPTPPLEHTMGSSSCDFERLGKGVNASLTYDLSLSAGESRVLSFVIAGSYKSQSEVISTLTKVQKEASALLKAKSERYQSIEHSSKLTIPDKKMEQAFRWVKYNTDWLTRDVEGLGRGITAGLPDYPWFFGADSEYALQGVTMIGMTDLVESTISLLDKYSKETNGDNGKILHEMSTNGAVYNPGNLNETPQFAILVWNVFRWTGDMGFLKKYYPTVKAGLQWLLEENDKDGNLLADGYGMMEIHGLASEMIDVAAYTQKAFADAAKMAEVMDEPDVAKDYQSKANRLKTMINADFWVEASNSYADFIGTAKDALHLIDGAIVRADTLDKPWAVEELKATKKKISNYPTSQKQGFVLYHNWVVNTPMEMGIADSAKAVKALETGHQFVNPFGMFVTGIDRDESAGTDDSGFAKRMKIFSYTGAVMTLPTGVQAIAENNYGRPDQALDYLERMTNSFSYAFPGSIYEVSPDFGMISQAWNMYSYAVPIISQFFGIQPEAYLKTIYIQPQMPSSWNEASIENVKIGNNEVSMFYSRANGETIRITQTQGDFKLGFKTKPGQMDIIKGETMTQNGEVFITGNEVEVVIKSLH